MKHEVFPVLRSVLGGTSTLVVSFFRSSWFLFSLLLLSVFGFRYLTKILLLFFRYLILLASLA